MEFLAMVQLHVTTNWLPSQKRLGEFRSRAFFPAMTSMNLGLDQPKRSGDAAWARRWALDSTPAQTAWKTPSGPRKMRADSAGSNTRAMVHWPPLVGARWASRSAASHADPAGMTGLAPVSFATCTAERTGPVCGVQPSNPPRTFSTVNSAAWAAVHLRAQGTRAEAPAPGPVEPYAA